MTETWEQQRKKGCMHPRMITVYEQIVDYHEKTRKPIRRMRSAGRWCPDCMPPLLPTVSAVTKTKSHAMEA